MLPRVGALLPWTGGCSGAQPVAYHGQGSWKVASAEGECGRGYMLTVLPIVVPFFVISIVGVTFAILFKKRLNDKEKKNS